MTMLCGTIWGELRTSHLYAVFKGPYVYFGETGHVPPVRWKGHLTSNTDFIGKLERKDIEEAKSTSPIFFVGIHIKVADAEPENIRKIARRAIEAELHRRFDLDSAVLSSHLTLLSTPPSSPVRHKFNFNKEQVATMVYEMIADEYRNWRKKLYKNDLLTTTSNASFISSSVSINSN